MIFGGKNTVIYSQTYHAQREKREKPFGRFKEIHTFANEIKV